jgi:hypothetical protein
MKREYVSLLLMSLAAVTKGPVCLLEPRLALQLVTSITSNLGGYSMSRLITRLCATAMLLGVAFTAQAQDAKDDYARPLTRQGSAAFILTLKGLGDFGLSGPEIAHTTASNVIYGIGTKYYVADDIALRVLLGFNSTSESVTDSDKVNTTTSALGVGVGAEYHFRPLFSTSPYIGVQVGFGSSSVTTPVNRTDSTTTTKSSHSAFSVGAIAGFDWFVTRGIAVGAEMSLGFSSMSGTHTDSGGKDTDLPSKTTIAIATRPSVHLLVYY